MSVIPPPERPLHYSVLVKMYPFLKGAYLHNLGTPWNWIMDEFYHRMNAINHEYTEGGEPYIRKVIMKMQSVKISRGVLKIVWDTLEVTNDSGDLLETPTRNLQEEILEISQRIEVQCANVCHDCGATPASLKDNQRGKFETLCDTCRLQKDIYRSKINKSDLSD